MPRKRHRFQTPPPADPIAAARDSSLALRLNIGFFLRQMGISFWRWPPLACSPMQKIAVLM